MRNSDSLHFNCRSVSGGKCDFCNQQWISGGVGASLGYSYAISESFALYALAVGNQVGGSFRDTQETCYQCDTLETKDIKSSLIAGGLGISWTVIGGKSDSRFSLGFFAGPSVASYNLSQRVVNTNAFGIVTDDFEMQSSPLLTSAFVGAQIGLRLGDIVINPYFIGFTSLTDAKCHDYQVTKVNVDGSLDGSSTTECGGDGMGGGSSQNQINIIDGLRALGVNFSYAPLRIGLNLYADSGEPKGLKGFKVRAYYLTFSFGADAN